MSGNLHAVSCRGGKTGTWKSSLGVRVLLRLVVRVAASALIFLLIFPSWSGCQGRLVKGEGGGDFNAGIDAWQDKDFLRARTELEGWLRTHQDPPADRALLILGDIARLERRNGDALRAYKELTQKFPLSVFSEEARLHLRNLEPSAVLSAAGSLAALHNPPAQTPAAATDVPNERRPERREPVKANLEVLTKLLEEREHAPGSMRPEVERRIVEVVDATLTSDQIEYALTALPADSFAAPYVLFKSGLLDRHSRGPSGGNLQFQQLI